MNLKEATKNGLKFLGLTIAIITGFALTVLPSHIVYLYTENIFLSAIVLLFSCMFALGFVEEI